MSTPVADASAKKRIVSMDQIRGFAILGMLMVDWTEHFNTPHWPGSPWYSLKGLIDGGMYQLNHHVTVMTFADVIAPLFMFVVGMGMRLSMLRRVEQVGLWEARKFMIKRYMLLVLIGFTIYTGYLWDALLNIGLAGLVALWVAERKPMQRFAYGLLMLLAYQSIFSLTSYGAWMTNQVQWEGETVPLIFQLIPLGMNLVQCNINGGPLGHWSWCLMMIMGTIAYDLLATRDRAVIVKGCLAWGIALGVAGWALTMPLPGVKEAWCFSKYYVTAPYSLWASALCMFIMLGFYVVCDVSRVELPHLTVLGQNPLFIYILQYMMNTILEQLTEGGNLDLRPGAWYVFLGGWAVFYGACYITASVLHRKKIMIRL